MFRSKQRGQTLILIAFGLVALIGITALAIDGSNAFSTRRHAQSAADNGAMAAALIMAQTDFEDYGISEALNVTASNGFVPNPTTSVIVISPPGEDCDGNASPYAGNTEYVQVIINTVVDTYLAPVVGIDTLPVCASAVAHAIPGEPAPPFYGSAIAATSCTASPAINATGSTSVTTVGGGIFSNSSNGSSVAINDSDNLVTPVDAGVTAVGGCTQVPDDYPSVVNCNQTHLQIPCPLPEIMLPQYTCDFYWDDFPPFRDTTLASGIHCIDGGIQINANDILIGSGVTLVVNSGGVRIEGNAGEIFLTAPESGPTAGILIYFPPENATASVFNGNASFVLVGSIFAPESSLNVTGDFSGSSMIGQWIGNTVDLSGSTALTITFDPGVIYLPSSPPAVELTN